jgi:predicted glycosyltransferase involved in capsule biosynthesis
MMDDLNSNRLLGNDVADPQIVKVGDVEASVLFTPSFDVVSSNDITVVFSVRLHQDNPWLIPRLRMLRSYYDPCPDVVLVDFGSDPEHSEILRQLCNECNFRYYFENDTGSFSLALARNIAAIHCETDFIFFCDPDFVAERDVFSRLARNASALNMRSVVDIILNPPAVHLDADDTALFEHLSDPTQQSSFLRYLSFRSVYTDFNKAAERYVAPYSNVFLINKKMFSMVGGYDSGFRGHGSEDFEFLLRLCIHSQHLPLPDDPQKDEFGPNKREFFSARRYSGFRRLFELMSYPAESLGLKVYHRYHPRTSNPEWYGSGDNKRTRFKELTDAYISTPHKLLENDLLPRQKKLPAFARLLITGGISSR